MRIGVMLALLCTLTSLAHAAAGLECLPQPGSVMISQDQALYLDATPQAWAPGWAYLGFRADMETKDGANLQHMTAGGKGGVQLNLDVMSRKTAANQITLEYTLSTPKDCTLHFAVASVGADKPFRGGSAEVTRADGSTQKYTLPMAREGLGKGIKKVLLTDVANKKTTLTLDPPADIPTDGAFRVLLAEGDFKAGKPATQKIIIDLPADVTFYASVAEVPDLAGLEKWFAWQPKHDYTQPSEIAMDDWSASPAGAKGHVLRKDDELVYDGKTAKFWGLNNCYGACIPDKAQADQHAQFYRKYGINAVRLHKYADGPMGGGIQSDDSTAEFDEAGLDRLDYYISKLKQAGIYVELSQQFGMIALGHKDLADVPYGEEFGKFPPKGRRIPTPASALSYSPELQKLHIKQITNLLGHKNPYTGLTYAEEPSVIAIEIVNENSVLFYTSMNPLKASATLRKMVGKQFCDYLRKRYGDKATFVAAWGAKAFNSFGAEGFATEGEDLDANNILPIGNPWFWDPENMDTSQAFRKRRLLDSMEFLHDIQVAAYQGWTDAVRAAGYKGEIVTSNWQAGSNISHYYNLDCDRVGDIIDRHNYWDGSQSMLAVPGCGMLSTGMQQTADRPFMVSEWIHTFPGEFHAEGPPIMAAYGMGLQDWDVSFMFENGDAGTFSPMLRATWDVAEPQIMAQFPAIARQVRRQDVKASDVLVKRYVHLPSLRDGKLGFRDKVAQEYDIKTFDSDKVPSKTLAVARCVVEFTKEFQETPAFDVQKYFQNGAFISTTGQLRWTPGKNAQDGFFTMDTPATKAVVGFADGLTCKLGEVTISPATHFASIYVTAQGPTEDIKSGKKLLVVAVARARNTDMKWLGSARMLSPGKAPILMEPVTANIKIDRPGKAAVYVLDQDGKRTDQTLPVINGQFTIDGAATKTPYYEVVFE